jgi:NhaA family Na+:H+ antiporter
MKLTRLFSEFFHSEKSGGLILVGCTLVSMLVANTAWGENYIQCWHQAVGGKSIEFWINDGLMTIFFLLVGLEMEREVYIGELSELRKSLLPVFAAIGGMAVPAIIHYALNHGTVSQDGIAVPMATDIAFSLGVLSLLGKKVPPSLKIFLTALAIIDDLGAIIVIAIFYAKGFSVLYFGLAAGLFAVMLLLNRLKVRQVWIYLLLGAGLWFLLHRCGVHATIAGVLTAFAIPFGNGDEKSPSYDLQRCLHKPVAFLILPLFALANTAIAIPATWLEDIASSNSLGIILGLIIGKPAGIFLFSMISIWLGISALPEDLKKIHLLWTGLLAGIGFTMSIFITQLAFTDDALVISSKIAIIAGSVLSGAGGFLMLKWAFRRS